MTREEMTNVVDSAIVILKVHTLGTADLRAVAAELRKTCEWKADDDGIFQTGCGHSFYFDGAGGPTEHQQKFCGYCGGSLIEVKP